MKKKLNKIRDRTTKKAKAKDMWAKRHEKDKGKSLEFIKKNKEDIIKGWGKLITKLTIE